MRGANVVLAATAFGRTDTQLGGARQIAALSQVLPDGGLDNGGQLHRHRLLIDDRLGCSLKDLIERAEAPEQRGAGLQSLQEAIDTNSSGGRLVFHSFGALAEFEKNLVRERTHAGLEAARARGCLGGRRKTLDVDQRRHVVELYRSRKHTVKEICQLMGISKPTLDAYVEEFADGPQRRAPPQKATRKSCPHSAQRARPKP